MSKGRLTFYRKTTWQDFVRGYKIVVDGVKVGTLRRGGTLTCDVEEGPHTCQARISWRGSPETTIVVRADMEVRVRVGSPDGAVASAPTRAERALSTDQYLALTVDSPS